MYAPVIKKSFFFFFCSQQIYRVKGRVVVFPPPLSLPCVRRRRSDVANTDCSFFFFFLFFRCLDTPVVVKGPCAHVQLMGWGCWGWWGGGVGGGGLGGSEGNPGRRHLWAHGRLEMSLFGGGPPGLLPAPFALSSKTSTSLRTAERFPSIIRTKSR